MVGQFLSSVNVKTSGKFIVSGNSKRGWTTLLITANDDRVVAALPIVYDIIRTTEVHIYLYLWNIFRTFRASIE